MNENISTSEELLKALEGITKDFPALKINTVVCSCCGKPFKIDDENSKPCEHFTQMLQEMKNKGV